MERRAPSLSRNGQLVVSPWSWWSVHRTVYFPLPSEQLPPATCARTPLEKSARSTRTTNPTLSGIFLLLIITLTDSGSVKSPRLVFASSHYAHASSVWFAANCDEIFRPDRRVSPIDAPPLPTHDLASQPDRREAIALDNVNFQQELLPWVSIKKFICAEIGWAYSTDA